jgi:citrate lyase subunit beta/citryl-CoA lyase
MSSPRARRIVRSFLYVPGNRRDRLDTAIACDADALIVDLEDSVPVAAKAAARAIASEWISEQAGRPCDVWVRINADTLAEDLEAVLGAGADGIVLPKADPQLLADADRVMTELEGRYSLAWAIPVIALVETAKAFLVAPHLAAMPRVSRLGVGEVDLLADLRIRPTDGREELTSLRLQIVVASAAAGIAAPVAPTSTDFRDLTALRRSTEALSRLGYRARTAIHPAQVSVINEVFTPSSDEVNQARRIIAALENAEREGSGVCVDEDGRMVDVAVVRSAREVIELAQRDIPDA